MQTIFNHKRIDESRFPILFASLCIFFLLITFFKGQNQKLFADLLIALIFGACSFVMSKNRKAYHVIIILGIVILVLRFLDYIIDNNYLAIVSVAIMTIYVGLVFNSILTYILSSNDVNVNVILGTVSGYLLMGIFFSFVFSLIMQLNNDALKFSGDTFGFKEIVYFTMVTQTTIGYGDITPVGDLARLFSYILGILGQMYIGIVMALIIGKFLQSKQA